MHEPKNNQSVQTEKEEEKSETHRKTSLLKSVHGKEWISRE